jgi:succinate-semialdehyde dehydrogenase/glutarate-semialdehyde dehydrogenase
MSYTTINPYDQSLLQNYEHHSLQDSFKKISVLSDQQKIWRNKPVHERALVINCLAGILRSKKEILAKQCMLEMGKPLKQGIAEVEKCAKTLEMIGTMATEQLKNQKIDAHYTETVLIPEPHGLVFSIQPWNFPYWQLFRMAACAWMAGNLVVLKHAEAVSGCAQLIEEVCAETGEALLVNLRLTHDDAAAVIRSRWISLVTLTGSTRAGKQIGKVAGEALKKQVLELGGSDAYIVMPDCDIEISATACAQARLTNSGQSCIAAKRFFVHESIYDKFRHLFLQNLKKAKLGHPSEADVQIGPMAAKKFADEIKRQINLALDTGAEFIEAQAPFENRPGFAPVGILDFGTKLNAFENEEVFGPVACFYKFKNVDDVVTAVNEGPYGLGGGIYSTDEAEALRIASLMEVGTFTVNTWVQSDARVPFGGRKESGLSYELGSMGLNEFVHWKVIGHK